MPNIIDTCRQAWNASRKDSQPEYDDLVESYQTLLTAKAEAVIASGMPEMNPFTDFELGVERLRMEAIARKPKMEYMPEVHKVPAKAPVKVAPKKVAAKAPTKKGKK